jgi:uncharacterized membrane protein YjgN (DUF898 family)
MTGDPSGGPPREPPPQPTDPSVDSVLFDSAEPPRPADVAPAGEPLRFTYNGGGGDIVGLAALNALLNIVTLTLYRFWGRTNVRRHILARTEINGEPMEYIGTGWEMFKGFLIVVVGILLPMFVILITVQIFAPLLAALVILPIYLVFFVLMNFAVYASRRYRFSRSTWRGIRFAMNGSAWDYSWAAIGYGLLNGVTLGWYAPASEMRLTRRLWSETQFGNRTFNITLPDNGLASPVYGPFAIFWVGGLLAYFGLIGVMAWLVGSGAIDPTSAADEITLTLYIYGYALIVAIILALLAVPYQAALMRRKAEMLGFEGADFKLDATFSSLLWLNFSNILILIFTLGFGEPITTARTFRYVFSRLTSTGAVDIEGIRQTSNRGPATGEGLADAFDIGGF